MPTRPSAGELTHTSVSETRDQVRIPDPANHKLCNRQQKKLPHAETDHLSLVLALTSSRGSLQEGEIGVPEFSRSCKCFKINGSSHCGRVAQLGEHLLCKQGVAGS